MNLRLICSVLPTANIVGPGSFLQRKHIVRQTPYIQNLVYKHYVPPLRFVRARIKCNYSRNNLWRYDKNASRPCYPANGVDAPAHVALYHILIAYYLQL